jgi:3-isopropylmalate/(R)-2-methylmalate dehydratase small subunit
VAKSFARIFFRNCINLGIPVLESADAVELASDGDDVTCDLAVGVLRTPRGEARLRALPAFAQEILGAGGVVAYLREHGDFPPVT